MSAVLKLVKPQPNEALIKHLEELLAAAYRGEIVGISGVSLFADGRTGSSFMGHCVQKPFTTINLLDNLRKKILCSDD